MIVTELFIDYQAGVRRLPTVRWIKFPSVISDVKCSGRRTDTHVVQSTFHESCLRVYYTR